jgi:hypothetical protein
VGYFTTVWRRGEKRKDGYRWVMDQGDALPEPLAAPEMIAAVSADCSGKPFPPVIVTMPSEIVARSGASDDGTLHWHVAVHADGSRRVNASYWDGEGWQPALRERVAAGSG